MIYSIKTYVHKCLVMCIYLYSIFMYNISFIINKINCIIFKQQLHPSQLEQQRQLHFSNFFCPETRICTQCLGGDIYVRYVVLFQYKGAKYPEMFFSVLFSSTLLDCCEVHPDLLTNKFSWAQGQSTFPSIMKSYWEAIKWLCME